MKEAIKARLNALRDRMKELGCNAFIVPTDDPHGSEYPADRWKGREWLTGFTGSAGTALVTDQEAFLWTDSRYWLQAEEQLQGTGIVLMREGEDADMADFLRDRSGVKAAAVGETLSVAGRNALKAQGVDVVCCTEDPFDTIWKDRPALPCTPLELFPGETAGMTAHEKLTRIGRAAGLKKGRCLFLSDLSEIAWALNLRGNDIAYNPVFLAYLSIAADGTALLYTDPARITPEIESYLTVQGVRVRPYDGWKQDLQKVSVTRWVLTEATNCAVAVRAAENAEVTFAPSPAQKLRAIKTEAEQRGFRTAMERDGAAMVKFLRRLDEYTQSGEPPLTERDADKLLTAFRTEQEGFCGLSFPTIAGYGPHGAIVHYEAGPETDAALERRGLLLLDSGAHYDCGTTDITRTIALGPLTDEERHVYTLVLKGHIGLSSLHFPDGTYGLELDLAARKDLWRAGYDFGHGTGHGVGARLCVHEGPQQIRKNLRGCTSVPFRAGMTITDEPGIYVPGRFGVRIENTLLVVPDRETPFGKFLRFEPLTLCPIDLRPVDFTLLSADECQWLDDYHAEVCRRLLPLLADETDRQWLQAATRPVAQQKGQTP